MKTECQGIRLVIRRLSDFCGPRSRLISVGSGRDERAPAYVRNVSEVVETADVPADADGDAEEVFSKRVSWAEVVKGGFESAHSLETIPV